MNVFYRTTRYILYSLIIVLVNANITNAQDNGNGIQFQRPMTLVTQDQIDIVKDRIANNVEPQASAYTELIQDADEAQSFTPDVPESIHILGGTTGDYAHPYWQSIVRPQSRAALSSALAYIYDGNTDYADKAIEILNAWGDEAPSITTDNNGGRAILIGRWFTLFVYAADLLWEYPGWAQADKDRVINYLTYLSDLETQWWRRNNIGDAVLLYQISFACLMQDEQRLNDRVINWIQNWLVDYSPVYPNNEIEKIRHHSGYGVDHLNRETGRGERGLTYSMMSGAMIASLAERLRLLFDWDILTVPVTVPGNPTLENALRNTLQWHMDWAADIHSYPFYEDYRGSTPIMELYEYWNNYKNGDDTGIQNWLNANRPGTRLGFHVDPYVTLNRGDIPFSVLEQNVPEAPELYSPENNKSDLSNPVPFHWGESEHTEYYELQISLSSSFSSITYANDEIESVPYEVHNLSPNTVYYWRVRAYNTEGVSRWSEIRSFTTEAALPKSEQTIILHEGWNSISSFMDPHEKDISEIFAGVHSNIGLVSNNYGDVYWPVYDINGIETWEPLEGYKVYMNRADTLVIIGEQMDPEKTPVPLSTGWNMTAYLPDQPMPVELALESIVSSLEIVTNNAGEIYWPAYNVNSIGRLHPGEGYKIYVTNSSTLSYPSVSSPDVKFAGEGGASIQSQNMVTPQQYKVSSGNTGSKSFLLLESDHFTDGEEVGVWNSKDILIGSGVVMNNRAALTIWGKNEMEPGADFGAAADEALDFTVWSNRENQEYTLELNRVTCLSRGELDKTDFRFEDGSVMIAEARNPDYRPERYTLAQNYPNPFNPTTTIRYTIPDDEYVSLVVYTMLGQKITTLVDEKQRAGQYEVVFEADKLASGVYFYRLTAGNYTEMKRMILLR